MAKKSLKRKHSSYVNKGTHFTTDDFPWFEKFSPLTTEELAVHKKKVSEVQAWIQSFFSHSGKPKGAPILILNGPPGTGKTVTVKAICKDLNSEVFVWSNTQQENARKSTYFNNAFNEKDVWFDNENQASSFSRFLLQSTKYSLSSSGKRVILVEEFPNSLLRDPVIFHTIIRKYSVSGRFPAVFIISDSTKGESLENRLFPKDLQATLKISTISFNPIAPTMLMKVMNRINNSIKVESGYTKLTKLQMDSIAQSSMGDIRNAINSMQFLCLSRPTQPNSLLQKAKISSNETSDDNNKRDCSLFLFHALGKILYCKREPSLKSEKDALPLHMKDYERDPLIANAEEVFERTSISPEAFALFLQENYISFAGDLKIAAECSFWLSEADGLSALWNSRDIMNEYTVSLAARGLMFNLTSQISGRRWRPLHKPQFYENASKLKQIMNTLKSTFKEKYLNLGELQTDFFPFIPKLPTSSMNLAQVKLAKELGEMNVKRINRSFRPLDEKDCFEMDSNDFSQEVLDGITDEDKDLLVADVEHSDEEVLIEEYDF